MSTVTKTYQWAGPDLAAVQASLGPSAGVKLGAVPYVTVTYDDTVADAKAADETMMALGWAPFTGTAKDLAFVLFAPNSTGYDVKVDNAGDLSTTKVP
jgi:hypothetical protein